MCKMSADCFGPPTILLHFILLPLAVTAKFVQSALKLQRNLNINTIAFCVGCAMIHFGFK